MKYCYGEKNTLPHKPSQGSPRIKQDFELLLQPVYIFTKAAKDQLTTLCNGKSMEVSSAAPLPLYVTWAPLNPPYLVTCHEWCGLWCVLQLSFSTSESQILSPPSPVGEELSSLAGQSWFENINSIYVFILATHKSISLLQYSMSELKSFQRYLVISLSLT